MVAWCPDWPVTAAGQAAGCSPQAPVAVLEKGRVLACSASARAFGVRRGMRIRDAQSRCPDLAVLGYDPAQDACAFEPVVTALEALVPGVQIVRPGTCAIRARGPSRYYGGDAEAAESVAGRLLDVGVPDCRVGVADGPFAAEQAARATADTGQQGGHQVGHRVHVVPPGGSPEFLAPLSVAVLERPELADLLRRLGLRTLGAFAELPAADVLARFGIDGALAHRLARGHDHRAVAARRPPPELTRTVDFEPPVDRADQVAFSVRTAAEEMVGALAAHGAVCTTLRVEVGTEGAEPGRQLSRRWLHPRWFDAADVVDRVRWQLEGTGRSTDHLTAPVVRVRLVPDEVDSPGAHADGLWGGGPEEHIHRALSRVQSMLGHEAVGTPVVAGGRAPADRQRLVPWGDRPHLRWPAGRPWPGSIPAPLPSTVFPEPVPTAVVSANGSAVGVDGRGVLSAEPAVFSPDGERRPIAAWAGPWPVEERWWDDTARRLARFQVVGVDGSAWLLLLEGGRWWVEARYD
ncbi:MAG TPA: DNA polymerase Y family protein [Nocardioidaceae bacterium]|nr:DNA polymerase Y family protein [Nocardioidaceae bacterium]